MSVVVKNITKFFGKHAVLKGLSLEIKEGEFHVILGPSGEGKSTLLAIIAGLLKPDTGNVWIDGQLVTHLPPQKRHIGFVFQDFALFPHLSVFENVAYGLKARGMKQAALRERVSFYLKMVGLENQQEKLPLELSGGQRQRVALARALAIEPRVLLLDEPLSHVDAWQREKLREDLKRIQQKTGVTTVYVTHDHLEARFLADRVSILYQGQIEQTETPDEIFYQPKTDFVAHFVGATNILRGTIEALNGELAKFRLKDFRHLSFWVKKYPLFDERKELSLCLHPEKILLNPVPINKNHFSGIILEVTSLGMFIKTTVNMAGLTIKAVVPRDQEALLKPGEKIWVCFDPEALHPLCGRSNRLPVHLRKCCSN